MSRNQTSNTATTTNVSTVPTAAQAQTAKELIAENIKLLIAQLEAGHSEGLTAYLTAWAASITTASATSPRSQGRSPMRPASPDSTRGTSLAAR